MPTDLVYTNLDLKTNRVRNLSDPALGKDAATKDYVDNIALGGDLSGTPSAASVDKLKGVAVSGTPSTGYVLTATGPTTAHWAAGSGGRPIMVDDPEFDLTITGQHYWVLTDGDGNAIVSA